MNSPVFISEIEYDIRMLLINSLNFTPRDSSSFFKIIRFVLNSPQISAQRQLRVISLFTKHEIFSIASRSSVINIELYFFSTFEKNPEKKTFRNSSE
ncbi:Uncharacterised protein [Vibrio cholerae]|uniref:Uncharacterized protein n=1 Tax=Vibrio cholerae TaxID=666 RepID=A0A655S4I2_VIBCL|nr:Uncharacterised protein [Vibrio cholerae]